MTGFGDHVGLGFKKPDLHIRRYSFGNLSYLSYGSKMFKKYWCTCPSLGLLNSNTGTSPRSWKYLLQLVIRSSLVQRNCSCKSPSHKSHVNKCNCIIYVSRFSHLPPCTKRIEVFVLCLKDKKIYSSHILHWIQAQQTLQVFFYGLKWWLATCIIGHYCHLLLRSVKVLEKGAAITWVLLSNNGSSSLSAPQKIMDSTAAYNTSESAWDGTPLPAHLEDGLVDLQFSICPVPLTTGFHHCSNPGRSSHWKTYAHGWSCRWTTFSNGTYSTKGLLPTQAAALEERVN